MTINNFNSPEQYKFLGTMAGNQVQLSPLFETKGSPTYGRHYTNFGDSTETRERFYHAFQNGAGKLRECKKLGEEYSYTPFLQSSGRNCGSLSTHSHGGAFFLSWALHGEKKYYSPLEYAIDQLTPSLMAISGTSKQRLLKENIQHLIARYFDPVSMPQDGDLIVYTAGNNISHIGIYRNSKPNWNSPSGGTVESKWGNTFVFQHDFFLIPTSFGNEARVYRIKQEIAPLPGSSSEIPSDPMTLFQLDRAIDALYSNLPWPDSLARVRVSTDVIKGYGDLSAAAKAIRVMQSAFPNISFSWILKGYLNYTDDTCRLLETASKFFTREDPVTIAKWPAFEIPADFVVTGPFPDEQILNDLLSLKIPPSRFLGFKENGFSSTPKLPLSLRTELVKNDHPEELFPDFFSHYFFLQGKVPSYFAMGLQSGSGIFYPQELSNAPLSLKSSCPHYLYDIEDPQLKSAIFEGMGGEIHRNTHSFNSGYATDTRSKIAFVEIVAFHLTQHEPDKNAAIVLNQTHRGKRQSTKAFSQSLAFGNGIEFYQKLGFGKIEIIGEEERQLLADGPGKTLTLILRYFIQPSDMKCIQLASQRILATGDNTAAEALAARCEVYVYECLSHKQTFLNQQISLAESLSPDLADLLKNFAHLYSLKDKCREAKAVRRILRSSTLGSETLAFCNKVAQEYSFEPILRNALLRVVYRSLFPKLENIERDSFDKETQKAIIHNHPVDPSQAASLLPRMKEQILQHIHSS